MLPWKLRVFLKEKQEDRSTRIENWCLLLSNPLKLIEIIGEAAGNVTDECREHMPQISWPNIIGMRNRLVHAYFDINLDILWKTVIEDIPPLIAELEKIVGLFHLSR